jgi:hypothetical protein
MQAQIGIIVKTNEQSGRIESIQKRALTIACGFNIINYGKIRFMYNLPSLTERRGTLCERFFFKSLLSSTSCLHYFCRLSSLSFESICCRGCLE